MPSDNAILHAPPVPSVAPIHTDSWFRQVYSLLDPEEIRWLYLSHDDGDRNLLLIVPPIFDGPTTRALFDERTSVLWAVDSFAALTPGAIFEVADLPKDLHDDTFALFNSMISPWHQWLDPARYARHVDTVERLRPCAVASAHGPVLRGPAITDAFARVRAMAGQPIVPPPGQETLDDILANVLAAGS